MPKKLMLHTVLGYPTIEESLAMIGLYDKKDVTFIEVQLPFSDPIADGPVLARANEQAAETTTIVESVKILGKLRLRYASLGIMTYFHVPFRIGLSKFFALCAESNIKFLIIPDLGYDALEYQECSQLASKYNIDLVPVLTLTMPADRLKTYLKNRPRMIYVTARSGVTGVTTTQAAADDLSERLVYVRKRAPQAILCVGFGIKSARDIQMLPPEADVAVLGSALLSIYDKAGLTGLSKHLSDTLTSVNVYNRRQT